jgi:hypothetical protein
MLTLGMLDVTGGVAEITKKYKTERMIRMMHKMRPGEPGAGQAKQ